MPEEVFVCEALKAVQNWCVWKRETQGERLTKVPYDIVTGKRAESDNRATWRSYSLVSDLLKTDCIGYNGLGFMISDGIVFIDVDHCIDDDGIISDTGKDVLSAFPESYAEISPSGHGIHILTRGTIPNSFNNRKKGVEMYASGRYSTYTGNAIQKNSPTEEQEGINYIYHKYSRKILKRPHAATPVNLTEEHSDTWIIRHASNIRGRRGHDFNTLFQGDFSEYPSASEADSALCILLAFWTDRNPEQMERIFRQSGLYRPKWEREDYRVNTINHACCYIPESLSEYQRRMNKERGMASLAELGK